ncbi:hypothetical protein SEA_GIBBLES_79 [Gordonia phage Gibbles]|uniref:Uncharacterized protein n=3 Tax=Gordonia phage Orchid TaxID=1838075 RepID=A0A161HE58_9CAUD|nr:hypothetical protein BH761_gp082 [Gordonia phage Orchid]ANA87317.1 hypothetical protein PBI_PATRICKSTAR_83 [Gordonia phage PatrickStar]ANA87428.1 hypothetical protein PBI_ORCHID_82 [Gordonia phage Orchid]ANA87543.1 hypothetical protein PBI_KAMPE_83 [Gordonia phage Kampe]QDK02038.1 hypothetical protein SEA_GIBBLES_79 [Gordonia phage Gibbles]
MPNRQVVFDAIDVEIKEDVGGFYTVPGPGEFTTLLDSIRYKIGVAQAKTGLKFKVRHITHLVDGRDQFDQWDIIVNDRVISSVPEGSMDLVINGIVTGAFAQHQKSAMGGIN